MTDSIHVRACVKSHPQSSGMRPRLASCVKVTKILLHACTLDTQILQRFYPRLLVRVLYILALITRRGDLHDMLL
jgi:hypothetical protein